MIRYLVSFVVALALLAPSPSLTQPTQIILLSGTKSAAGGCSQATTFLARTSGENTSALTTMICGLVTDGVITGDLTSGGTKCGALLDRFYILAMANSSDALLDVCGNATMAVNGSPTFTANAGYAGTDATGNDYLNTGYVPSAGNYQQNSAHISGWALTNVTSSASGGVFMGAEDTSTTAVSVLYPKYSDGNSYGEINDNGTALSGVANATSIGFYVANRTGASTLDYYKNGTLISSPNSTSNGLPTAAFALLALSGSSINSGSALQMGEASIGAKLTSGQITSMNSRICTYLTAVHGSC